MSGLVGNSWRRVLSCGGSDSLFASIYRRQYSNLSGCVYGLINSNKPFVIPSQTPDYLVTWTGGCSVDRISSRSYYSRSNCLDWRHKETHKQPFWDNKRIAFEITTASVLSYVTPYIRLRFDVSFQIKHIENVNQYIYNHLSNYFPRICLDAKQPHSDDYIIFDKYVGQSINPFGLIHF